MRWLALFFLCANVLLWYYADVFQPPARSSETLSGTLPRVASLKAPDGHEAGPVAEGVEKGKGEERGATDGTVDVEEVAAIAVDPVEQDPVEDPELRRCVRIGWLESREGAEALIAAVDGFRSLEVAVEEVERERTPLNWVLIPPQPSERALRQFRAIQRQGIDSYLVTEGEYRNAISLGLFESREAAISVLEEKKRQNLNAVLAKYDRNQISYALDFSAEPDLAENLVQAVTSEYGKNFDFIENNPCEGVATPEKTP